MPSSITRTHPLEGPENGKLLCLTICGYRKQGMGEEDYRNHMNNISAPMTQDLMVKYGIIRWTQIHNQEETRALMSQLFDPQMARLADIDCFSQVVFRSVDDYKRMKQDPWYKKHLVGDHEKFADTKRSMMTIGWIRQFIDHGQVSGNGVGSSRASTVGHQATAIATGCLLSGAMMALSLMAVPVFLDTAITPDQLVHEWARMYHYGHRVLPGMAVTTFGLYLYTAISRRAAHRAWVVFALAGLLTLAMVPFTWLVMVPTNDILFGLEAERVAGQSVASLEEVRGLVTYWSALHLTRSMFPLSGALLGALATFEKLAL